MSNDWKARLKLDKYNLDKCALEQPELYVEAALEWAEAVEERDNLKENLSIIRGDCDLEVRKDPSQFGWDGVKAPTEAFISGAINTHPAYVEANKKYLEVCTKVNKTMVIKEGLEQRRKMIEVLTNLYVNSYFSANADMDKNYQAALDKSSQEKQVEGLSKNARLKARKGEV